jgi:hypothetical protein
MKTILLTAFALAAAALTGCDHVYAPPDSFAEHGPHYGDTPDYFNTPQPGIGGHADSDN